MVVSDAERCQEETVLHWAAVSIIAIGLSWLRVVEFYSLSKQTRDRETLGTEKRK